MNIKYPPPYARGVWNYGKAQFYLIIRAIGNFDWNKLFSHHNIHNQVNVFDRAIILIFRSFIPNEVIFCSDKELPWLTDEIRLLIKRKKLMFQTQNRDNRLDLNILNKLSDDLTTTVTSSKLAYHRQIEAKPNDPKTVPETYWSILKLFVNAKMIQLIPTDLVNVQIATNFLIKANLHNDFYSEQCNTSDNGSTLPHSVI